MILAQLPVSPTPDASGVSDPGLFTNFYLWMAIAAAGSIVALIAGARTALRNSKSPPGRRSSSGGSSRGSISGVTSSAFRVRGFGRRR